MFAPTYVCAFNYTITPVPPTLFQLYSNIIDHFVCLLTPVYKISGLVLGSGIAAKFALNPIAGKLAFNILPASLAKLVVFKRRNIVFVFAFQVNRKPDGITMQN